MSQTLLDLASAPQTFHPCSTRYDLQPIRLCTIVHRYRLQFGVVVSVLALRVDVAHAHYFVAVHVLTCSVSLCSSLSIFCRDRFRGMSSFGHSDLARIAEVLYHPLAVVVVLLLEHRRLDHTVHDDDFVISDSQPRVRVLGFSLGVAPPVHAHREQPFIGKSSDESAKGSSPQTFRFLPAPSSSPPILVVVQIDLESSSCPLGQ